MISSSNGDLSQHFKTIRQTSSTKANLNVLSGELATGKRSDVARSLGSDTSWLSILNREISASEQYGSSAEETGRRLMFVQTSLQQVENLRQGLTGSFLSLELSGSSQDKLDASLSAVKIFGDLVGNLNQSFAGKNLLSGTATNQPPLADPDAMLADMRAEIAGLTTAADIEVALDFWFDDPAGGFSDFGYQGDSGPLEQRRVSANQTVQVDARADQSGIRGVLRATAHAAIISDLSSVLSEGEFEKVVNDATLKLVHSADALVDLRGRVGFAEATVDEVKSSLAIQVTSLSMVRNSATLADPFETSAALLNAQQQLELQFSLTARLSGLSLVNYL